MSDTELEWCPGCQANVKPRKPAFLDRRECPNCGHDFGMDFDPVTRDVPDDADPFDIPDVDPGPITGEPVRTPAVGPLTLNPKVKNNPKVDNDELVPLCPECQAPIERVEPNDDFVEFRCGCDDLRYFEFPEREGVK